MEPGLAAFTRAVQGPDADIDLARVALWLAWINQPSLSIAPYLDTLNRLAEESRAESVKDHLGRLHRVREFLFGEEGFRGNTADYYDPRNSFLHDVLDRRLGIPITLALVFIEVGRRVGLAIDGIGLPGHFIVAGRAEAGAVLLDPFNGGALLTHRACADLVAKALGRHTELSAEHFVPVTKRQFLTRILNNLKAVYWGREDWPHALAVTDHLLALDPASMAEVRDRGTLLHQLGDYRQSLAAWERYLTRCPEAPDAEAIRAHLRRARMTLASLN